MTIKTDRLAYWYFRLNGFLGIENFIVHDGLNENNHLTEIDYLGVRFCHRKELYQRNGNYLEDDFQSKLFSYNPKDKIYIILSEVKLGEPQINESWYENPAALISLFQAIGIISFSRIKKLIVKLQTKGSVSINQFFISFVCVGNNDVGANVQFGKIPIISWDDVTRFIYKRVRDNQRLKRNMNEWGNVDGRELFNIALDSRTYETFRQGITIIS